MGFGTSIVLLAAGAILRFAVSVTTSGFNIHTIGVILMVAGALGLVLSGRARVNSRIFWAASGEMSPPLPRASMWSSAFSSADASAWV